MEGFVKVKWLKPHSSFGYFEGETGYITPAWAEKLLPQGYIMLVPETDAEVAVSPSAAGAASPPERGEISPTHGDLNVNTLPEDMPGRDKLFEAGYKTLEQVKGLADPMDAGVSKVITGKLKKYLKDK